MHKLLTVGTFLLSILSAGTQYANPKNNPHKSLEDFPSYAKIKQTKSRIIRRKIESYAISWGSFKCFASDTLCSKVRNLELS